MYNVLGFLFNNHCPQLAYVPPEVAEYKISWFSYISHCVKGKIGHFHCQASCFDFRKRNHICSIKCKLPRFEVLLGAIRPLPLHESSFSVNMCCFPVKSWRHTSPFWTLKETPFLSVEAFPFPLARPEPSLFTRSVVECVELLFDCKEFEELDTPWFTVCFFKPLVAVLLQSEFSASRNFPQQRYRLHCFLTFSLATQ